MDWLFWLEKRRAKLANTFVTLWDISLFLSLNIKTQALCNISSLVHCSLGDDSCFPFQS